MPTPDSQPSTGVSLDHVTAGGNITIGDITVHNITFTQMASPAPAKIKILVPCRQPH